MMSYALWSKAPSCDDGWAIASSQLLDLTSSESCSDNLAQGLRGFHADILFAVLFQIQTNSGTWGTSTAKAEDKAWAICICENVALVWSDIACHRVSVGEVSSGLSLYLSPFTHEGIKLGEDLLSLCSLKALVVVSLIVVTSILRPVLLNDLLDADELPFRLVLIDVS